MRTRILFDVGVSPVLKKRITEAVKWFNREYLPRTWSTNIIFVAPDKQKFKGKCICSAYNKYCEVIIVATKDIDDMFITLFHELVHVEQYATGRLIDGHFDKYAYWNSKVVRYDRRLRDTKLIMKTMPWEKEAYTISVKLWRKYNG